jgi:hypothetical protein
MSSSVERSRDQGEDHREEITSPRPGEPADNPPDPWATVPLEQGASNGTGATARLPAADAGDGQRPSADDPWMEPAGDPWIDVTPGLATGDPAPRVADSRGRQVATGIALVAGGAVVGALLVGAYTGRASNSSATALTGQNGTAQNGPVQPGVPGANGQDQPGLQGQGGGQGFGGAPGFGGNGGEQRIRGTVTAVSSSRLSVKSSSGTATYTIASDTQIVRNGRLASPSDLRAGDAVLVHVFPAANSGGVLERIIAQSSGSSSGSTSGDDSTT